MQKIRQTEQQLHWTLSKAVSAEMLETINDIKKEATKVGAFYIDGFYFFGDLDMLARQYAALKPSSKFITWLVDQGYEITLRD